MPDNIRTLVLLLVFCFTFPLANGQQLPEKPISYRIFTPFLFNPAIAGSRDYSSMDVTAAFQGESKARLLSWNTRFTKTEPTYFSAPEVVSFRHTGMGAYLFQDISPASRNSGAAASFAYHIPLNRRSFSFLSFGIGLKGYFSSPSTSANTELDITHTEGLHTNMDLGVYYYGTKFYAGLSSTSIFGSPQDSVNTFEYRIPVSRKYYLNTGYKFLIVRSLDILLEPSLISEFDSLTFKNAGKHFKPLIKLYLQNFCIGTYFHDKNKNAFFFQYKYPRFYLGGYFALPKESPYYPKDVIVEITAGITFSKDKSRFTGHSHW